MSVLDRLRAEREHEVKLPSGLMATIVLPWVQDCIAAVGDVPLPVLQELQERAEGEAAAPLDPAQMEIVRRYNEALVRFSVKALDGERVELPADEPLSAFIDEDDALEIVQYASRTKALPGE